MAIAQLSEAFSSIKGVIGGTIFQGYRGNTMIRTRHSGPSARSAISSLTRSRLAALAGSWKNLKNTERDTWIAGALVVEQTDKFGNPYFGSGYQLYMQCNSNLYWAGNDLIDEFPSPFNRGRLNGGEEVDIIGMQDKSLVFDGPYDDTPSFVLQASRIVSAGRVSPARDWKTIAAGRKSALDAVNIYDSWTDVFGFQQPDYTTTWYRLKCVNDLSGLASPWLLQKQTYIDPT